MATLSLNENNLQKNNQNNNNSLISDELIFENALPLSSKKEEDVVIDTEVSTKSILALQYKAQFALATKLFDEVQR